MISLKFESFEVSDVRPVNTFLEKHGDRIGADSVTYAGDRICFIYREQVDSDEDREKDLLLQLLEKTRSDTLAELLGADANHQYHQVLAMNDG